MQGTKKTFYKRGQAYGYSVYRSGGSKTVNTYNAYNGTLYVKVGGSYTPIQWTAYQKDGSETFYLRGQEVTDLYYSGGDEEVWLRGELCPTELHYAGTKRANLKLATLETTHLYGLIHT